MDGARSGGWVGVAAIVRTYCRMAATRQRVDFTASTAWQSRRRKDFSNRRSWRFHRTGIRPSCRAMRTRLGRRRQRGGRSSGQERLLICVSRWCGESCSSDAAGRARRDLKMTSREWLPIGVLAADRSCRYELPVTAWVVTVRPRNEGRAHVAFGPECRPGEGVQAGIGDVRRRFSASSPGAARQ